MSWTAEIPFRSTYALIVGEGNLQSSLASTSIDIFELAMLVIPISFLDILLLMHYNL